MKTSLCITCWHKDVHYLNDLFHILEKQTVYPDEIIVVGNSISKLVVPRDVKSFFVTERKPVSWSRNKAKSMAENDIVIFFDVDDIPHPQKIEVTKEAFEKHNAECFVHGFLENQKTDMLYKNFDYFKVTKLLPNGMHLSPPIETMTSLHHGHIAMLNNISLVYNEQLGFYEKGFQWWGEDSDMCVRLFINGYNIIYSSLPLINYRPSYKDLTRKWYMV